MSVFGKSLRDYFLFTRTGLLLLLAVGVARFILGVSGVPYDRVTHLVRTVAEIISHSWMDATCSSTSAGKRIF